jgi:hypothetical protein
MEKIGKIMMVVFIAGILVVPLACSADGLTMPPQADVGYAGTETDLVSIVENIIKWVVGFIVLISIFMFAYGGLTYLTAGGDESKVENAKKFLGVCFVFGLVCYSRVGGNLFLSNSKKIAGGIQFVD